MSVSPTPQLDISNEMRAVVERSVEQAKVAFQQLMQAAEESISTSEERGTTSQVGALDISKKAMTSAERNVLSAFELAQKIVQTKDTQELVRMQTEFLQSQMQALGEQVKDLGETISKAVDGQRENPHKGRPIVLIAARQARRQFNKVDCYPARRSRAPHRMGRPILMITSK